MPTADSKTSDRIDIKTAVARAVDYLQHLYAGEAAYAGDVLLEEVEPTHRGDWLVTLGFDRYRSANDTMEALRGRQKSRVYKVFTVDGETGEVKSMKIRELERGA